MPLQTHGETYPDVSSTLSGKDSVLNPFGITIKRKNEVTNLAVLLEYIAKLSSEIAAFMQKLKDQRRELMLLEASPVVKEIVQLKLQGVELKPAMSVIEEAMERMRREIGRMETKLTNLQEQKDKLEQQVEQLREEIVQEEAEWKEVEQTHVATVADAVANQFADPNTSATVKAGLIQILAARPTMYEAARVADKSLQLYNQQNPNAQIKPEVRMAQQLAARNVTGLQIMVLGALAPVMAPKLTSSAIDKLLELRREYRAQGVELNPTRNLAAFIQQSLGGVLAQRALQGYLQAATQSAERVEARQTAITNKTQRAQVLGTQIIGLSGDLAASKAVLKGLEAMVNTAAAGKRYQAMGMPASNVPGYTPSKGSAPAA